MGEFVITGPDGVKYRVRGENPEGAMAALRKKLDSEMSHQPKPPSAPEPTVGMGEGLLRGALQGGTFGAGDEIVGAMAATAHPLVNGLVDDGSTWGQRYDHYRDREREKLEAFQNERGPLGTLAEVGGAIPTALAAAPAVAGGTMLGMAGRGAAIGAGEAGLYGFLSGEGGAAERFENAAGMAPFGAALGAAAPFAAEGTRRVASTLAAPVMSAMGRGAETRANRYLGKTLERSGRPIAELDADIAQAAMEGQPGFMMADAMGRSGQRALSTTTRQPNDMREEVVSYLDKRQAEQGERLGQFLAEGFDAKDTAAQRAKKLSDARRAAAEIEYKAAEQGAKPVNLNDALSTIDAALGRDPILGDTALSKGEIGGRLVALRDRLQKGGEQLIDFREVLNVKSDLFNTLQRNPDAGPELRAAYGALDKALEAASPGYRQANDNYRAASQAIDAIESGQAAASPRRRSADVADEFGRMKPQSQAQYRTGYGDTLIGRVEAGRVGADKSAPLMTQKVTADIDTLATSPELLKRRIGRERTMFETRRQATGGSQTADNLADSAEASGANAIGMAADVAASGGIATVARALAQRVGSAATGKDEETLSLIAKALMSREPATALAPVLAQAQKDKRTARIVEALIRRSALPVME